MLRKKIILFQFLNLVKEKNKNLNHPLVWSLLLFLKSSFQQIHFAFPMKNVNSESGTAG